MTPNPRLLPLLVLGYASSLSAEAQAPKRPNVVFILADDLGYGDVGVYGQRIIRTPHIDELAREGVRFTDFYAGSSVSAPSRASLLTGLHTGHTRIRGNREHQPEGQEPMASGQTLGTLFREHGYRTGLFGKWGLGYLGSGAEPQDRGFDAFFGYNCQRMAHYYYPPYLYRDREREELEGNEDDGRRVYAPERIQAEAEAFISSAVAEGKPFFALLAYTLPHAELNLPHDSTYHSYRSIVAPRVWDGRDGYPPSQDAHASFASMVTKLDGYVGQVRALLRRLGVEQETIIVFTSDNGPHREGGADPEYFGSSGGLRGIKRDLYEGGIRVPMIVRWGEHIPQGTTARAMGAFWDFLPTFAELLGGESPRTDGVSLLELWQSPETASAHNERALYWEFHEEGGKQALRLGAWKLIALEVDSGEPRYELYNLESDPREEQDLARQYPDRVQEMLGRMLRERTTSELFPFRGE